MLRFYKDKIYKLMSLSKVIFLLPLFILIHSPLLEGEEITHLNFNDLPTRNDNNGQEVEIRGFVYKTTSGDFIISPVPNLKSCCVGAQHNVANQIYLEGDSMRISSEKSVLLRGHLHVNPEYNSSGTLTKLYTLTNWNIVPENTSSFPYLTTSLFGIIIITFLVIGLRSCNASLTWI